MRQDKDFHVIGHFFHMETNLRVHKYFSAIRWGEATGDCCSSLWTATDISKMHLGHKRGRGVRQLEIIISSIKGSLKTKRLRKQYALVELTAEL